MTDKATETRESMNERTTIIRTNGVQISYQLRGGGCMIKMYAKGNPAILNELRRLRTRRTDAIVQSGGHEIGAVWKLDGRWTWYLDHEAAGV